MSTKQPSKTVVAYILAREPVIKTSTVVSKPGAAMQVVRVELTDKARQNLTVKK